MYFAMRLAKMSLVFLVFSEVVLVQSSDELDALSGKRCHLTFLTAQSLCALEVLARPRPCPLDVFGADAKFGEVSASGPLAKGRWLRAKRFGRKPPPRPGGAKSSNVP
jgi:hypothetical protein